jgi:predicted TIM-barrel fold metal-dependent hydrolase
MSTADLRAMADAGVCGIRCTGGANTSLGSQFTADMIEPTAKRAADFGWHTQIYLRGDQILELEGLLSRLSTPIVFDHMGVLLPAGVNHPGFRVIRRLIDAGRTWVKLSGAYITTAPGADGLPAVTYTTDYAPASTVARAFIQAAPERMLWGSDWPHPGLTADRKPNDAALFDLLLSWVPDERTRHRILVDNPETLYGFPKFA